MATGTGIWRSSASSAGPGSPALPVIGFQPDVIHCHDWQTGLVPVLLKDRFHGGDFFRDIKSVITIHNPEVPGRLGCEDHQTVYHAAGLLFYP